MSWPRTAASSRSMSEASNLVRAMRPAGKTLALAYPRPYPALNPGLPGRRALSSRSWPRTVASSRSMSEASLRSETAVYSCSSSFSMGRCRCSCTRPRKQRSWSRYASCRARGRGQGLSSMRAAAPSA